MPSPRPRPLARSRRRSPGVEAARITANRFVIQQYPFGCLCGTPRSLAVEGRRLWFVPILLTSPGYGIVGEVGAIALDRGAGRVVGSTPRNEVAAACQQLREGQRDALETAFHRARTV